MIELKNAVSESLNIKFNETLYYESIKSKCLDDPESFFSQYCQQTEIDLSRANVIFSDNNSAFTGINKYIVEKINKFIECLYLLENKELFEVEFIQKLSLTNDYFKFLLNIDNFNNTDIFDINWLIDISSGTFFKRMNDNIVLKNIIVNQILMTHNKYLHQIYFKYFLN